MTSFPPPSPYTQGSGQYPTPAYQPPPKKRGLKRIIFGSLGIVANAIGLFVMPFVASIVVAVIAFFGATPQSQGSSPVSIDASDTSVAMVYVPATEAHSVSCRAEHGTWESQAEGLTTDVDGTEYALVGMVQADGSQNAELTCDGASDIAIADFGASGTLIAFVVGLAIPVVLGLVAIALLIWGIIARIRS